LGFIEVTQGIDIGDTVVVRGTQKVRDGSRVNVKTEKRN
jgi:SOS-response transcriptional repressor LexA